jgi:hypothetical protein
MNQIEYETENNQNTEDTASSSSEGKTISQLLLHLPMKRKYYYSKQTCIFWSSMAKPKFDIFQESSPLGFLCLFFDNEKTNRHAEQQIKKKKEGRLL